MKHTKNITIVHDSLELNLTTSPTTQNPAREDDPLLTYPTQTGTPRKHAYAPRRRQPLSPETRRRISETMKGKEKSAEHRQRISETMKGLVRSKETRQRMSAAKQGALHPHWSGGPEARKARQKAAREARRLERQAQRLEKQAQEEIEHQIQQQRRKAHMDRHRELSMQRQIQTKTAGDPLPAYERPPKGEPVYMRRNAKQYLRKESNIGSLDDVIQE
jgi:hypothetical protein